MQLTHEDFMKEALRLAEHGRGSVEPNPVVGAVVVFDENIVGRGFHEYFGGPHAEVNAIREAGASANDSTLYVTLEPCAHFGKTPPCADAVIEAGVRAVVVAMRDPNPLVNGKGIYKLRSAGIEVIEGVLETEAKKLNRPFLKLQKTGLPYVIAKWAMSVDGRIATAAGESKWITSDEARKQGCLLRAGVRAVMVGIGTVLADDPVLTLRDVPGQQPVRIIVDSKARLPVESQIVQTAREIETYVAVTRAASSADVVKLCELGCKVLEIDDEEHPTYEPPTGETSLDERRQEAEEKRKVDETAAVENHENSLCPVCELVPPSKVPHVTHVAVHAGTGRVNMRQLMQKLAELGMLRVMVEGGAELLGCLFDARLVDEVFIFVAPMIIGGKNAIGPIGGKGIRELASALRLSDLTLQKVGSDFLVHGLLPLAGAPGVRP
jgi:diaminohydroxyphosphoribosylaminopyrimidine deaminase/5-amino-6-(5-phosphoribosylamino)uracil reductase